MPENECSNDLFNPKCYHLYFSESDFIYDQEFIEHC